MHVPVFHKVQPSITLARTLMHEPYDGFLMVR